VDGFDAFVRRSTSVSAEIVAHIETLISSGSLSPGTKLPPERELARVLKVSRVSLREAMHELEAKRVIERRPGRGTIVMEAPPHAQTLYGEISESERTLRDVAELRETIEPQFARLAAERATAATLFALEQVLEKTGRELSREESLKADISFHMLLAQASQNPLMVALNSLVNNWTASVRSFSHETPESRRSSHDGHQLIFNAVSGGNGADARDAMLAHLAEVATLTRGNTPSQPWRLLGDRWVAAAQVSLPAVPNPAAPAGPFDTSVWRAVGDPLVAARARGPLDGVGVAVKDLFAVAGQSVGAGVPAWLAEQEPQTDSAPALAALLDAGAHVVGIARTDEFAYSLAGTNAHYGTPPNPAAPGSISGGSTSGPTSAVALGQAAVGLGTDTAGSIRVPASYQGLVGLRTTHGAISTEGVLPLARSFDTVGWVTPDVRMSALIARTVLGGSGGSVVTARRTVRLTTVEALARADVQDAFAAAVEELVAAGKLPSVEAVDLPPDRLERWFQAFRNVQAWEAWQAHGSWITAHPGALGADVAARFAQAAEVGDEQAAAARELAAEAREQLGEWLAGSVLVIPSASGPAPALRPEIRSKPSGRRRSG
jgi:DNA-binding FadR family transcriptional regulator